jgi:hypothetical protein
VKKIYALMTLIGIVLPFSQFIVWINQHGLNFKLFFRQIIENPIAAFAWLDVVITVMVIIFMVINDGNKHKMKRLWVPILASLMGGASVGLPLFLYMKQCHLEQRTL